MLFYDVRVPADPVNFAGYPQDVTLVNPDNNPNPPEGFVRYEQEGGISPSPDTHRWDGAIQPPPGNLRLLTLDESLQRAKDDKIREGEIYAVGLTNDFYPHWESVANAEEDSDIRGGIKLLARDPLPARQQQAMDIFDAHMVQAAEIQDLTDIVEVMTFDVINWPGWPPPLRKSQAIETGKDGNRRLVTTWVK